MRRHQPGSQTPWLLIESGQRSRWQDMRGHMENEFEMYFSHSSCLAVVMFRYLRPELLARGLL